MKVTQKHFELFKKECIKWKNNLELNNWNLFFDWQESDESLATSYIKISGYSATIKLNKDFYDIEKDEIEEQVKLTAKHEMMHILIARPIIIGKSRFISEDELREAEEELVNKLSYLII